jgi:hypothetical protein
MPTPIIFPTTSIVQENRPNALRNSLLNIHSPLEVLPYFTTDTNSCGAESGDRRYRWRRIRVRLSLESFLEKKFQPDGDVNRALDGLFVSAGSFPAHDPAQNDGCDNAQVFIFHGIPSFLQYQLYFLT